MQKRKDGDKLVQDTKTNHVAAYVCMNVAISGWLLIETQNGTTETEVEFGKHKVIILKAKNKRLP